MHTSQPSSSQPAFRVREQLSGGGQSFNESFGGCGSAMIGLSGPASGSQLEMIKHQLDFCQLRWMTLYKSKLYLRCLGSISLYEPRVFRSWNELRSLQPSCELTHPDKTLNYEKILSHRFENLLGQLSQNFTRSVRNDWNITFQRLFCER